MVVDDVGKRTTLKPGERGGRSEALPVGPSRTSDIPTSAGDLTVTVAILAFCLFPRVEDDKRLVYDLPLKGIDDQSNLLLPKVIDAIKVFSVILLVFVTWLKIHKKYQGTYYPFF